MQQTELEIDFSTDTCKDPWANRHRRMPAPQYLGAKYKFLPWLCGFIPEGVDAVLDGFSGSQSFSFEMKKHNRAVISNDFLGFCHTQGVALVENKHAVLTGEDLEMLFGENKNRSDTMLGFQNIFFIEDECICLDNFRANVELLDCRYKRALALAVMFRSLTRKTIMGHFAHLRALPYAKDPVRIKRNPSIARPIRDLFVELLPEYNAAIFDNGKANKSYRENILDLLPKLQTGKIDLAYYDPPYCSSHADYQAFYHLLETFVEGWGESDKKFINRTRRYHPPGTVVLTK